MVRACLRVCVMQICSACVHTQVRASIKPLTVSAKQNPNVCASINASVQECVGVDACMQGWVEGV